MKPLEFNVYTDGSASTHSKQIGSGWVIIDEAGNERQGKKAIDKGATSSTIAERTRKRELNKL